MPITFRWTYGKEIEVQPTPETIAALIGELRGLEADRLADELERARDAGSAVVDVGEDETDTLGVAARGVRERIDVGADWAPLAAL